MTSTKEPQIFKAHFPDYQSAKRLEELSNNPLDLTQEGVLSPERIAKFCQKSCGFKLLYATERVTEEVIKTLYDLAKEASVEEKMRRMQAGDVINFIEGYPSEKRPALHTAVRDLFRKDFLSPEAQRASQLARAEYDKLCTFIDKVDAEGHFTDLIMVAIGGSDLGPRANYFALEHCLKPNRRIHFISNVDPDDTAMRLKGVDLSKSLVVVVSKSGGTLETLTNAELVRHQFQEAGLNPKDHFIAVTGKGSPMDDPNQYHEQFYIWDWIGGRYSSTSMVGGVMLSFAFGIDVYREVLEGAHEVDQAVLNAPLEENIPLLMALLGIWNHNFLNCPTLALIPYSQPLWRYAAHIQQVDMESNGKRVNKYGEPVSFQTGPIIWGEAGTNAQHSFYQLIHQSTATVPLEFVGFKENQFHQDLEVQGTTSQEKLLSNLFAQAIALATGQRSDNPNQQFPGNRPSHMLLGRRLTPRALGALLATFEHKVVYQGFIWNINSFDQEGVQLGKKTANKIINCFAEKRGKGSGEAYPLGDAFLKQLEEL